MKDLAVNVTDLELAYVNVLVKAIEAKRDSGKQHCPATVLIKYL